MAIYVMDGSLAAWVAAAPAAAVAVAGALMLVAEVVKT